MQCLRPNKGYYDSDGKHIFGRSKTGHEQEHDIPCGYCETCRTNKAKLRGFKSFTNSLYVESSCFITLTYGTYFPVTPNGLPTLDKSAVPNFVKRLRKKLSETEPDRKIGVMYCAEYGEKGDRPHYHLIIFNYDFPDKKYWRTSKGKYPCYRSAILEQLWPYGHAEIGTVTPASATYVSSYIYKKKYGPEAVKHYQDRVPEYVVTPKRNFVSGREYIRKNIDSIASYGCFKTLEGHSIGIDTHTMNWIKNEFPEHYLKIKLAKEEFDIQTLGKQDLKNWEVINASKIQHKRR